MIFQVLLLLIQLTKGNANIQKIVAFENAFDRIFDVISQEGLADGGIVVEDCLLLMLNLLRGNISNQNFFKEGKILLPFYMQQTFIPFFPLLLNPIKHQQISITFYCFNRKLHPEVDTYVRTAARNR